LKAQDPIAIRTVAACSLAYASLEKQQIWTACMVLVLQLARHELFRHCVGELNPSMRQSMQADFEAHLHLNMKDNQGYQNNQIISLVFWGGVYIMLIPGGVKFRILLLFLISSNLPKLFWITLQDEK